MGADIGNPKKVSNNYIAETQVKKADNPKEELTEATDNNSKQHKLFVSHSGEDKEYVLALVEMFESIGIPDESLVCTSVSGHGIPGGAKIYDWLREQFIQCDLRVLFVLGHYYYDSVASLNEMGATWLTKSTHTLLLLPGFDFSDIKGCIDPSEMGISFDMEEGELKHRLNELKDALIKEHQLPEIVQARWERHRDKFIKTVREISMKQEEFESPR